MEIKFINGINRVTGSCTWLRHKKTNTEFLVDCGMVQGEGSDDFDNAKKFLFDPIKIKYVFLTHSHLDHCGLIPKLYKEGFKGKVYCSKATSDLSKIVLMDSAKHSAFYTKDDVAKIRFNCIDSDVKFKFGQLSKLENDLLYCCNRTSHILGSLAYNFNWIDDKENNRSITFSGDLGNSVEGNKTEVMLKESHPPHYNAEYMVLESTYGLVENKKKYTYSEKIDVLKSKLEDFLNSENLDTLIIPTFSQHRYQQILFDIYHVISKELNSCFGLDYQINKDLKNGITGRFFYNKILNSPKFTDADKNIFQNNLKSIYNITEKRKEEKEKYDLFSEEYKNISKKDLKNMIIFFEETSLEVRDSLKKFLTCYANIQLTSNMGNKINEVYLKHMEEKVISKGVKKSKFFNNDLAFDFELENIKLILSGQPVSLKNISFSTENNKKQKAKPNKKQDNHKGGTKKQIILTSSGMCSEGKVLEYLDQELENKRSLLWLTGYQSGGTNGEKLLKLYNNTYTKEEKELEKLYIKKGHITLDKINIHIDTISDLYSGHIFPEDLVDNYVFYEYNSKSVANKNSLVFLNHGGNEARKKIKEKIMEKNEKNTKTNIRSLADVMLPKDSKIYDLNTREWKEDIIDYRNNDSISINEKTLILAELRKQTKLIEEQNENIKRLLQSMVLPS